MALLPEQRVEAAPGYRHEALLYSGDADLVDAVVPFVRDGLEADEPVLVALQPHKIIALRDALDRDADEVDFVDMADVGRNPARIIPQWQTFLNRRPRAHRARGVSEPIWRGRSPDELVECHRHESLLNVAVKPNEPFWLVCLYDVDSLSSHVIDEAFRNHPIVTGRHRSPSTPLRARQELELAFLDAQLTPPPPTAESVDFTAADLHLVRQRVRDVASRYGLAEDRAFDLELAASEASANSVRHGGGRGRATLWAEHSTMVCEITDTGHIDDPLAGRRSPDPTSERGRGMWLINQLCDLAQIRVRPSGTVVRLHVDRNGSSGTH